MPDTPNNKRNPYYAKAGQVRQTKRDQTKRLILGGAPDPEYPTDFGLNDPSIQSFGGVFQSRSPNGFVFKTNSSDPRSRLVWPSFPAGTRIRCKATSEVGGLWLRMARDPELGPTNITELARTIVAGSIDVDVVVPAVVDRDWMGFVSVTASDTITVTDWIVDYPVVVYDPDAQALFDRFDIEPTAERKQLISDRFVAGKATTWWAKLDALWVHAAHGAEAGRLNWLSPRFNCLPVNEPAFVVDRGYMGDGVSSYLDTQFNPVVEAPLGSKYQQNSASFGIRSNTDNTGAGSLAGFWDGSKGTTIQPRSTNNHFAGRANQANPVNTSNGAVTSSVGMFGVSRTTVNSIKIFRQGVPLATSAIVTSVLADGNLRLGGINSSSLRACQFCMGFIGGGLTDAEMLSLYEWFQPYREALGIT